MHIYPNYYEKFCCIADKCKHNCCIGWEIDIDETTFDFYKSINGEFGNRLRDNISTEDTPHFILKDDERCPFLNDKNLCDIITTLGENQLCDICREHPRFHNELPDRVESGLGLCCEEAARLILSQKEKVTLNGDLQTDDEIILLRDKVIKILQDRESDIKYRINNALEICNADTQNRPMNEWCDILLSLEQLDPKWTELLKTAKNSTINTEAFELFMNDRTHEYEQFIVYLAYRHLANSPDFSEFAARLCFISFAYELLLFLGAVIYDKNNYFNFCDQVELCRMFSSEIEYSDENLYTLFDIC